MVWGGWLGRRGARHQQRLWSGWSRETRSAGVPRGVDAARGGTNRHRQGCSVRLGGRSPCSRAKAANRLCFSDTRVVPASERGGKRCLWFARFARGREARPSRNDSSSIPRRETPQAETRREFRRRARKDSARKIAHNG